MSGNERVTSRFEKKSWASRAFILESVLLLMFLAVSLSLFTQMLFTALDRSVESRTLDAATIAASSIAEHFADDPSGVESETQLGDLRVVCETSEEQRTGGGTMHFAHIAVFDTSENGDEGTPIYMLDTSRYEAGDEHAA